MIQLTFPADKISGDLYFEPGGRIIRIDPPQLLHIEFPPRIFRMPIRKPLHPQFEKDMETFRTLKNELLKDKKYSGKWVVVYKGEIGAVGDDDRELAKFVHEKYGNVPAYIGRVVEEEEVLELPSPEVE